MFLTQCDVENSSTRLLEGTWYVFGDSSRVFSFHKDGKFGISTENGFDIELDYSVDEKSGVILLSNALDELSDTTIAAYSISKGLLNLVLYKGGRHFGRTDVIDEVLWLSTTPMPNACSTSDELAGESRYIVYDQKGGRSCSDTLRLSDRSIKLDCSADPFEMLKRGITIEIDGVFHDLRVCNPAGSPVSFVGYNQSSRSILNELLDVANNSGDILQLRVTELLATPDRTSEDHRP